MFIGLKTTSVCKEVENGVLHLLGGVGQRKQLRGVDVFAQPALHLFAHQNIVRHRGEPDLLQLPRLSKDHRIQPRGEQVGNHSNTTVVYDVRVLHGFLLLLHHDHGGASKSTLARGVPKLKKIEIRPEHATVPYRSPWRT